MSKKKQINKMILVKLIRTLAENKSGKSLIKKLLDFVVQGRGTTDDLSDARQVVLVNDGILGELDGYCRHHRQAVDLSQFHKPKG